MPAPLITPELQETLRRAFESASLLRNEFVTLEHLVLALLDDGNARRAIVACGGRPAHLRGELRTFLDEVMETLPETLEEDPRQTIGVGRVLQRAAIQALSADRNDINGAHVLIQVYTEPESHAVYFLEKEGVAQAD